jgi:adenine specific DNA methylase Mod
MNKEQKFYNILQELFVGAKLDGDGGFVNLMNIKTDYFNKIRERIKKEIKDKFGDDQPEDLFDKLYTFFDSYFSDGGAIFFSSTPVYKNIYAKVYSDRDDTELFWKTAKLYYVKSEANYKSIKDLSINSDPEIAFDFDFDTSLLKHKQANEKKELEFYFIGTQKRGGKKIIKFRVLYKNDNKYTKLQEILKTKDKSKTVQYLLENIANLKNLKIILANEGLDYAKISDKGGKDKAKAEFIVSENKDLHDGVSIEPAISETKEIEKYLKLKGIVLSEEEIEKAFKVYKKQTEIDYFIHKDAKGFLREQFDLYMYQHLAGSMDTAFNQESLDRFKKIKAIAYLSIDFIGNFEDELKKIWLKPKFARNSNYVLTLDRITKKKIGAEIIVKIIKAKGIKNQIDEWRELGIVEKNFNQKEIIKDGKLNKVYQFLPIDTKYFKDLEIEIIGLFDNLDEELDGRLIKSDNFQALNTLLPKYKEQVQTIYIDPPFNTGNDFDFVDNFQDSTWLTLMNNRIELSKLFLKDEGNFYLHLDHIAEHYAKILLDKELGANNFKAKITWNTGDNISGFKSQALNWIRQADFIHYYSKTEKYFFCKVYELLDKSKNNFGWLDILGKDKKNLFIEKWVNGVFEKIKVEQKVKAKGTIWNDIYSFQYSEPRITESFSFVSNQKPENLVRRIVQSSSEPNDIVFDFFVGSGTTCAVCQKIKRKWIGVEMGDFFNETYLDEVEINKNGSTKTASNPDELGEDEENNEIIDIKNNPAIVKVLSETKNKAKVIMKKIGALGRMKIVLKGDKVFKAIHSPVIRKPHLSKDVDWNGGGFFKYYELEQYEDALKKSVYNPTKDELENIDFSLSEKEAKNGLEIDLKKETARFVFEKLYPDVDIAETISNIFGKKIKKISKDKVIFENDFEVDLNNLDFKKYEPLKKLIYW